MVILYILGLKTQINLMLMVGRRAYIITNSPLVYTSLQNQNGFYALRRCFFTEKTCIWGECKHPWPWAKYAFLDGEIKQPGENRSLVGSLSISPARSCTPLAHQVFPANPLRTQAVSLVDMTDPFYAARGKD